MSKPILEVKELKTHFFTEGGVVPSVDGVSFEINAGQTLGVVGESGSGKSVTSLSIMRLVPSPPGRIVNGDILFEGESLLLKTDAEMRDIRGNRISMIFQEPMTSLNPVYTIGKQISEAIILHQNASKKEALARTVELLKMVKVSSPEKRITQYPHQLSGGMRQRVMIAMALSCRPALLIADEPTTALDVTIQAQILNILQELRNQVGMAVMLITHDLGVVAESCDQVLVMYCGRVVERASTRELFKDPRHPYTVGLMRSIPQVTGPDKKLIPIRGTVPAPSELNCGCRFQTRCDEVFDRCFKEEPPLFTQGARQVRCWKYESQPPAA